MTFWDDISNDFDEILTGDVGSISVTYTPHDEPESGYDATVILISLGRMDDASAAKVTGHVYFSENEIASPQYQDSFETESGDVWKMIMDAGSNGPMKSWIVDRDLRKKPAGR